MRYYPHSANDFQSNQKISDLPCVYAITTDGFKHIKIGKSINMKQRMKNIQSGCPFKLFYWLQIRTPLAGDVEGYLHKWFEDYRTVGEWFEIPKSKIDDLMDFFEHTNREIRKVSNALL